MFCMCRATMTVFSAAASGPRKLFVGCLNFSLSDADIRLVFEPFGQIDSVDLQRDDAGRSRGYAFVQYVPACKLYTL
jgi:RNA recognition motif-containing protein